MKSNSDVRPPILQDLGDGSWHYNYNVKEVQVESKVAEGEKPATKIAFEYETVHIWGTPDYVKIAVSVISERYSKDDEIAFLNKGIEDKSNADYVAYQEWVNGVKAMIKNDLKIN
jgi:hypothetical protein